MGSDLYDDHPFGSDRERCKYGLVGGSGKLVFIGGVIEKRGLRACVRVRILPFAGELNQRSFSPSK